jgi:hypothetical protein
MGGQEIYSSTSASNQREAGVGDIDGQRGDQDREGEAVSPADEDAYAY